MANSRRVIRVVPPPVAIDDEEDVDESEEEDYGEGMNVDVEDDEAVQLQVETPEEDTEEEEVDLMAVVEDSEEDQLAEEEAEEETATVAKPPRMWPEVSTERAQQYQREVQAIRDAFRDDVDIHDTTMVSEYAEDIFEYMNELEVRIFHWSSSNTVSPHSAGENDARCGLHDPPKRNHLGNASNPR